MRDAGGESVWRLSFPETPFAGAKRIRDDKPTFEEIHECLNLRSARQNC